MTETLDVPISGSATASDGSELNVAGSLTVTYTPAAVTPPPPPPPPPPSGGIVFGTNEDITDGLPAVATTLGTKPLLGCKVFLQGIPSSVPGLPSGITHPLFCLKPALPMSQADQSALANFVKLIGKAFPSAMVTLYQEGEHDKIAMATLLSAHVQAYAITHASATNVKYVQTLMTWDASGKFDNGTLSEWVAKTAAGGPIDMYGFDTYPNSPTSSAASVLGAALSELEAVFPNAPYGITECNYTTNLTGGETLAAGSAPWFSQVAAWLTAQQQKSYGPETFFVYARTDRGVPWPPDAVTITELSAIAHASGL